MIIKIKAGVSKTTSHIWSLVFAIKCRSCLKMGKYCIFLSNLVAELNSNSSLSPFWESLFCCYEISSLLFFFTYVLPDAQYFDDLDILIEHEKHLEIKIKVLLKNMFSIPFKNRVVVCFIFRISAVPNRSLLIGLPSLTRVH